MDVTDRQSIANGKSLIAKTDGKLHILVNNAGQVGPTSHFINQPDAPESKDVETLGTSLFNNEAPEEWAQLFSVNVTPIFSMTTAFLGLLDQGAREKPGRTSSVINITSISGITKISQGHLCYNSAKAAADHLTKMLATEFALKKIPVRVNAIAPGVFATEMTAVSLRPEDTDKVAKGLQPVPARRAGTAQEVAGTALYLASEAGGYTNGQVIVVDGGYLAVNP